MLIIVVPWKPVVFIWLLLSAMLWCGYVESSLMEGKNPFAAYTIHETHVRHSIRTAVHHPYSHKLRIAR
jgi:hypothetical protein